MYFTGNLCNQALHVLTEHFSHFAKMPKQFSYFAKCLGISHNDRNIRFNVTQIA